MAQRAGSTDRPYQPYQASSDVRLLGEEEDFNSNRLAETTLGNISFPDTLTHKNALTTYLAESGEYLSNLAKDTCASIVLDLPVIFLTSGIALAVQYFSPQFQPIISASPEPALRGAVAVAKFVGLAFFLQAAIRPYVEGLIHHANIDDRRYSDKTSKEALQDIIHAHSIRYLTPLALTVILAYKKGLPVDALKGTLYTAGIFGLMKVLNKGYDSALEWYASESVSTIKR